jgi:hypothetical protein
MVIMEEVQVLLMGREIKIIEKLLNLIFHNLLIHMNNKKMKLLQNSINLRGDNQEQEIKIAKKNLLKVFPIIILE